MSAGPNMNGIFPYAPWRQPAAVGVLASAICILGGLFDPVQFMCAYLPAWLFFWGLSMGSMALLMIYHLIDSAWGFLLRRILEAGMRTLPLVALLFIPIALDSKLLYPWAQPELVAASEKLQHESFYLNYPYFLLRATAYFVLWLGISFCLSAWSRRQDENVSQVADARLAWKCNQLSAVGAVIYGITMHFATIDWAMTLIPAFHSTIWGPLFALGQLLSALALAVVVFAGRSQAAPLDGVVSHKAVNDMGSLMFTFLIGSAYMAWFQFMLVWIANLPVDIIYYLPRTSAFWLAMIWAIVILHYAIPFVVLLLRSVKRNALLLAQVGRLLLVMDLLYMYYQIIPMFPARVSGSEPLFGLAAHWMNFVMPIAMGGLWLAAFQWQLGRRPLLVAGDGNSAQASYLRRLDDEEEAREKAAIDG